MFLHTTHSSGKQKSTCKIHNYYSELAYKKGKENVLEWPSRFFLLLCIIVTDCSLCQNINLLLFIFCSVFEVDL